MIETLAIILTVLGVATIGAAFWIIKVLVDADNKSFGDDNLRRIARLDDDDV